MRLLAASLLSMGVILLWTKFFAPKAPPASNLANRGAQSAPATPGNAAMTAASGTVGANAMKAAAGTAKASGKSGAGAGSASAEPVTVAAKADTQEHAVTVENDLYRVMFSNRGAVVKSWELKKYMDDSKPQKVLDVVHPEAAQQTGGWPFALVLDDEEMQSAVNGGLYQISSPASTLQAPADAEFSWSDGH